MPTTRASTSSRMRAQRQKAFRAVFPNDVSTPGGDALDGPHSLSLPASLLSPSRTVNRTAATRSIASTACSSAAATPSSTATSGRHHAGHARGHSQHPGWAAAAASTGDQLKWDRAWHAVTSRIQLPSSVSVEDSFGTLASESQDLDDAFHQSLAVVLDPGASVPRAPRTDDILSWHGLQVRQHFLHHVLPLLAACTSQQGDAQVLLGIVETLEAAHRQYLFGLQLIVRGLHDDDAADAAMARFRRDLHALVSNSWTPGLMQALRGVLQQTLGVILASGSPHNAVSHSHSTPRGPGAGWRVRAANVDKSRDDLFRLLESLQKVGLAGDKLHVFFAEVMDGCMHDFIKRTYSRVWKRPKARDGSRPLCMDHLSDWIEKCYGRLAVEVLSRLGAQVAWSDVERWRDIAVGRLATLRMHELFDIVLEWPQSAGGLDDLGYAVTTPQRRLQLTDTFSAALQRRLLHPGRSTLDILQTYISMIRTFHALDHSKVLLDRVVPALKLCLWMRDDAIRIVVTGLLANHRAADAEENKGKLVELAAILDETSQQQRRHADEEEPDWNDMTWVPDPVDAGVNYKRPKNEDIIGTLIGALGLQDVFIKEFQAIVAERLLSQQPSFQQEIKVLGLLKKRFGEASLQNCDVMTKDIADSQRVDALIGQRMQDGGSGSGSRVLYHAKILSRLFWPSLSNEAFAVPAPVAEARAQYETGFARLKSSRRLSWLDHLGSATVELELEDRSVEVECRTYEAAIIHQFHDDGRQRHFDDLWGALRIDEDLLESGLRFWVGRGVLRDVGDRTFAVLERLDGGGASEGSRGRQPSPKKGRGDGRDKERRGVYWQFIVGMLTNSSPAMPLAQIGMMMRMLIADGCAWSDEELQGFLGDKVAEGVLEFSGGKYRLKK